MEMRYTPNNIDYRHQTTEQLKKSFLIDHLFVDNKIEMIYTDIDRAIVGTALPVTEPLKLESSPKEMSSDYFTQKREIGVINIGGSGKINVDGKEYLVEYKDAIYIGRGKKEIIFSSSNTELPAKFYFVSYPAHAEFKTELAKFNVTESAKLGSVKTANKRTIYKYIHPNGIKSSQLVMGLTELEEGSVWNTMPVHTHQRRTEVYMYFNIEEDSVVVHLMGEPDETRHLILRNQNIVLSPSWSIHSGVGTSKYSFIWAMGGENQDFDDMDSVSMNSLK